MHAIPITRWIVYAALVFVIAWDLIATPFRLPTITAGVRAVDVETGTLFRWFWLGLWLHFFVGAWPKFSN
jgi:hypothetical protein